MKDRWGKTVAILLALSLICACSTAAVKPAAELNGVRFAELAPGVWLHTSFVNMPVWGAVPTNGLVVEHAQGSLLVDTAWNNEQTESILLWAKTELRKPISRAVFTHAHDDKMGGVAAVNSSGIASYASALSNEIAPTKGLTPATHSLEVSAAGDSVTKWGLEIVYPGGGHTVDNIAVWLPTPRVLFGGCLVRPPKTQSLGNTTDAQMRSWDTAVELLRERYSTAKIVVPSHGPPAGLDLLKQTIDLVRDHRSN